MVHEGIKPYQCPKCYEGFTQTGNLKPHIKTIHEGKKPSECEFGDCPKNLTEKTNQIGS